MMDKKGCKEFEAKYEEARKSIATANGCDMGIATDYLVSSVKGRLGICYSVEGKGLVPYEVFAGLPESLDVLQCFVDFNIVMKG